MRSSSETEGRSFLLTRWRLGLCLIAASSIVRFGGGRRTQGRKGRFSFFYTGSRYRRVTNDSAVSPHGPRYQTGSQLGRTKENSVSVFGRLPPSPCYSCFPRDPSRHRRVTLLPRKVLSEI